MKTEFSKMLEEYRAGLRGLPTYDELAAMLEAPAPVRVFQLAEQNEQLARDAQAILDAEMYGVGFLVDGVSVHPSRVMVLRPAAAPQVVADERSIKTWIERAQAQGHYEVIRPGQSISHMEAEIADLRIALTAAPAAQGDALNAKRYEFLRAVGPEQQNIIAHYAMEEMDKVVDAAIAAKAAS